MSAPGYILVVEDNRDLREVIAAILESAAFTVRTAGDGGEALEMIAAELPALVVLDLFLPTIDGWKMMERIKSAPATAGLPVVAISAGHAPPPPGVSAFLKKPFDVLEFVTLVRRFARRTTPPAP